jgi:hypothetical protein
MDLDAATYSVSPNPASDVLHIRYTQTELSKVSDIMLIDMNGKMVMRKTNTSSDSNEFTEQFDVSSLSPGIYVLQIRTSAGIVSEKVSIVD